MFSGPPVSTKEPDCRGGLGDSLSGAAGHDRQQISETVFRLLPERGRLTESFCNCLPPKPPARTLPPPEGSDTATCAGPVQRLPSLPS